MLKNIPLAHYSAVFVYILHAFSLAVTCISQLYSTTDSMMCGDHHQQQLYAI